MLSPHNGGGGLLNPKILKNLTFLKHINFWQYSWPEPNSEIFIQILNPMRTGYCGQKIAEPNKFCGLKSKKYNIWSFISCTRFVNPFDLQIGSPICKKDERLHIFFENFIFFCIYVVSRVFSVSNLPLFFRFDASVPMYQYIENVLTLFFAITDTDYKLIKIWHS